MEGESMNSESWIILGLVFVAVMMLLIPYLWQKTPWGKRGLEKKHLLAKLQELREKVTETTMLPLVTYGISGAEFKDWASPKEIDYWEMQVKDNQFELSDFHTYDAELGELRLLRQKAEIRHHAEEYRNQSENTSLKDLMISKCKMYNLNLDEFITKDELDKLQKSGRRTLKNRLIYSITSSIEELNKKVNTLKNFTDILEDKEKKTIADLLPLPRPDYLNI